MKIYDKDIEQIGKLILNDDLRNDLLFPIWNFDENDLPVFNMKKPKGMDDFRKIIKKKSETEVLLKICEKYSFYSNTDSIFYSMKELFQCVFYIKDYHQFKAKWGLMFDPLLYFNSDINTVEQVENRFRKSYNILYYLVYCKFSEIFSKNEKSILKNIVQGTMGKSDINSKIIWKKDEHLTRIHNLILLITILKEKGYIEIPGNKNLFFGGLPQFISNNFVLKTPKGKLKEIEEDSVSKSYAIYGKNVDKINIDNKKEINRIDREYLEKDIKRFLCDLIKKDFEENFYFDCDPLENKL